MCLCMRSPNIQELMLQEKEAPHIMILLSVTECVSPKKGAHIKTMKNIRFFSIELLLMEMDFYLISDNTSGSSDIRRVHTHA